MIEYHETAQLQIGQSETPLFGQLMFVDESGARLRPITQKTLHAELPPSSPGRLFYFNGPRLVSAPASVEPIPGGDLLLSFTGAHLNVERRYCERVHCDLTVSYRSVRTSNTYSAWHSGVAQNVSSGGLGLWVDTEPPASGLFDLRVSLPGHLVTMDMQTLFATNPGGEGTSRPPLNMRSAASVRAAISDRQLVNAPAGPTCPLLPPLRLQGQIRHVRRSKEGPIYVGLRYTAITPTLYWQLTQLVQAVSKVAKR